MPIYLIITFIQSAFRTTVQNTPFSRSHLKTSRRESRVSFHNFEIESSNFNVVQRKTSQDPDRALCKFKVDALNAQGVFLSRWLVERSVSPAWTDDATPAKKWTENAGTLIRLRRTRTSRFSRSLRSREARSGLCCARGTEVTDVPWHFRLVHERAHPPESATDLFAANGPTD